MTLMYFLWASWYQHHQKTEIHCDISFFAISAGCNIKKIKCKKVKNLKNIDIKHLQNI